MRIDFLPDEPQETSMLETSADREGIETPAAAAIVRQHGGETIRVEPWGRSSVRVRVSLGPHDDDGLGALLATPPTAGTTSFEGESARLVVDDIAVDLGKDGRLRFSRMSDGEELLAEEPIRYLWPGAR